MENTNQEQVSSAAASAAFGAIRNREEAPEPLPDTRLEGYLKVAPRADLVFALRTLATEKVPTDEVCKLLRWRSDRIATLERELQTLRRDETETARKPPAKPSAKACHPSKACHAPLKHKVSKGNGKGNGKTFLPPRDHYMTPAEIRTGIRQIHAKGLLASTDAAQRLSMTVSGIGQAARNGRLSARRVGGLFAFKSNDIETYKRNQKR